MLVVNVGGWNDGAAVVEGQGVLIDEAAVGGGVAMSDAVVEGRMIVGEAVGEAAARC